MIANADEFVRLRTSDEPEEYLRAVEDSAPDSVWFEVLALYPEMTFWVVQNKTVPLAVLSTLVEHPDVGVRTHLARKRKLSEELFSILSDDSDEYVRLTVANNPKTPSAILLKLSTDRSPLVADKAQSRLTGL